MGAIGQFIREARRRRAFRVAALYVVAAWVTIQVAESAIDAGLLHWSPRDVFVAAFLGFPVALIVSWYYDITRRGIVRTPPVGADASFDTSLRKRDYLLFVSLAAIWILANVFVHTPPPVDKSIAILPFENPGHDPNNAMFAFGIRVDLQTQLQNLHDLKVIARESSDRIDADMSLPEMGLKLGAAYIMKGSVERVLDQLRISVVLIDAEKEAQAWAGSYDRALTASNWFDIRNEISGVITDKLQAELSPAEQERLETKPTENFAALQAYLVGKQRLANRTRKDTAQAIQYFEDAIKLDSDFALAYVGLADAYTVFNDYGHLPDEEYVAKVTPLIDKALSLDDSLGEAYVSLGSLKGHQEDIEGAEAAFQRAIKLNPSNAQAYQWYAVLLQFLAGRPEEALDLYRKAVELDPLSPIMNSNLGSQLSRMGRYEEAMEQRLKNVEINPDFPLSHGAIGTAYYWPFGQADKAVASYRESLALDPEFGRRWWRLGMVYLDLGDETQARYWLGRLLDHEPEDALANLSMGMLHLGDGDHNQAREYFELAVSIEPDFSSAIAQIRNFDLQAAQYTKARSRYADSFPELLEDDQAEIDAMNYGVAIDLAAVLTLTGERELAAGLLDRSLSFAEAFPALRLDRWSAFVEIYALQGKTQAALAALRKAIDLGDRWLWWYHFELNPNLKSLHDEPEFQAMAEEVRADMAAKLSRLQAMEASGELAAVPSYRD